MTAPETLQAAFGLAEINGESLTPWATVLRARTPDGHDAVVKVTATKPGRAEAMAAWTRALAADGIPVVSPLPLDAPNPQLIDGQWWVVYPFVDGDPYRGGVDDARAAGDLLGRLHAAPVSSEVLAALRQYEFPDGDLASARDDLETLRRLIPDHLGEQDAAPLLAGVEQLLERWWHNALPTLRAADAAEPLPRTGVSSDFRSTNIIRSGAAFVLVDPDNGGCEPRLFDLAMAVVLFHREARTAPGRMFSADEWHAFYGAYSAHVTLTEREREFWPLALDHMLWEEGTWALEDTDAAEWADPRERGYLTELAVALPEDFPLH